MVPKEEKKKGGKVTGDRGMESGIGGWRVVELLHALIKSFFQETPLWDGEVPLS